MNSHSRSHPWPIETNPVKYPRTTAIVSVNYNTKYLITQLIWSIYKNLLSYGFAKLLIIDNNSTDGSQEILRGLAKEGLIEYIENKNNLYHGPALNQAFDYLSVKRKEKRSNINAIWVIDSDCIVLRPDTLESSTKVMTDAKSAIVGQPVNDKWNQGHFGLHSLLIDPEKVWRDPIKPFEEHGEPSKQLQESSIESGLIMAPFNFTKDKYVIHLGRGTLAEVVKKQDKNNKYFEWAKDHFQPHFAGEEDIEKVYKEFKTSFDADVPNYEPETIIKTVKKLALAY